MRQSKEVTRREKALYSVVNSAIHEQWVQQHRIELALAAFFCEEDFSEEAHAERVKRWNAGDRTLSTVGGSA
jgi:hypothetical protein